MGRNGSPCVWRIAANTNKGNETGNRGNKGGGWRPSVKQACVTEPRAVATSPLFVGVCGEWGVCGLTGMGNGVTTVGNKSQACSSGR